MAAAFGAGASDAPAYAHAYANVVFLAITFVVLLLLVLVVLERKVVIWSRLWRVLKALLPRLGGKIALASHPFQAVCGDGGASSHACVLD